MLKRCLTGVLAVTLWTHASHARADEASASTPVQEKNPWLAAGLSLGVPTAMVLTGVAMQGTRFMGHTPFPAGVYLAIASPLAFGAGHVYAGDPLRGLVFTALVPAVSVVGAGVGAGMGMLGSAGQDYPGAQGWGAIGGGLWGAVLGLLASSTFTAWDAFHTADRKNHEAQSLATP